MVELGDMDKPDVPDVSSIGDITVFPCGCRMTVGESDEGPVFLFEPCKIGCEIWDYVRSQAAEFNKPTAWTMGEIEDILK